MILLTNRIFPWLTRNLYLAFFLLCIGCIKPEKPPVSIIPKDTMAHILMDIHISEAKVFAKHLRPDSAFFYYEVYRRDLYDKYKIKPQRFQESFDYYMRNLNEMDKIYEAVVDSLSLMEGRRGKIK